MIIHVSGEQGCGKTLMTNIYADERSAILGFEGVLFIDATNFSTSRGGKQYHTIICRSDCPQFSPEAYNHILQRLTPNGVFVIESNVVPESTSVVEDAIAMLCKKLDAVQRVIDKAMTRFEGGVTKIESAKSGAAYWVRQLEDLTKGKR